MGSGVWCINRQAGIAIAKNQLMNSLRRQKMQKLLSNTPIYIFAAGAIIFMLAPLELIPALTSKQMAMTGLVIESIGITTGLLSYFQDYITEQHLN